MSQPFTAHLNDPTGQALLLAHRRECAAACSRLHHLRSVLDQADGFLKPRFVSTLAVLALLALLATTLIGLAH